MLRLLGASSYQQDSFIMRCHCFIGGEGDFKSLEVRQKIHQLWLLLLLMDTQHKNLNTTHIDWLKLEGADQGDELGEDTVSTDSPDRRRGKRSDMFVPRNKIFHSFTFFFSTPPCFSKLTVNQCEEASSDPLIIVFVTTGDKKTTETIATALVKARLAACVNAIPGVTSYYRWEGKVHADTENLLMIKTRSSLLSQLTKKVEDLHPYDCPEVIATPIVGGRNPYLDWIRKNTEAMKCSNK